MASDTPDSNSLPCDPPRDAAPAYDALLLVSFGGPEGPGDVLPFLENVTRGKPVPKERLVEVAARYERFGGVSPTNAHTRAILTSLIGHLNAHGPQLAVYWGNRNWHPLLTDVLAQMAEDGVRRAMAVVTSPFGSYSGCRQYSDDIEAARAAVGPTAPIVDKLRLYFNHPGYIEALVDRVAAALAGIPEDARAAHRLVFAAHSVPLSMAATCPYEQQLREAAGLVADRLPARGAARVAAGAEWDLVFQSRSGPPSQPWLGPSIEDYLRQLAAEGAYRGVLVVPLSFLADNMEVVYDLDVEAAELCATLGLSFVRAATIGNHPRLVEMFRELVLERLDPSAPRLCLGSGPWPDECTDAQCRPARPQRPPA